MGALRNGASKFQRAILWFLHQNICAPMILGIFNTIFKDSENETLVITIPSSGYIINFGSGSQSVRMMLIKPFRFCLRMATDPKMGISESYMYGEWIADPSPKELLSVLIRAKRQSKAKGKRTEKNQRSQVISWILVAIRKLAGSFYEHWNRLIHQLRSNTPTQSRQNVEDHYDLSNEMFKLFLDSSLTYSCALFSELPVPSEKMNMDTLLNAQMNKCDALLELLNVKSGEKVLEIGCGWGGLAIHGAEKYDCEWTGLTISQQQYDLAQKRVYESAESRKGTIDIKYLDYRDETGLYDHIVSVEMIEHVGHDYLPKFFNKMAGWLRPGGNAVLQAIICRDEEYDHYRHSSDFIKKHIFPGGHMPSLCAIREALPECLLIKNMRPIGQHYSPTLDIWCKTWVNKRPSILKMGYSDTFHRKWEMYFSLCSALFENENINIMQIELQKT
ncbi:mycolic acid cyclopropane synthetase domain-containing protein [Ditylenchus destructor]|nr:mycolic acid cyclopropane synthetase domain-containing protein [Ditylenchus destructor]